MKISWSHVGLALASVGTVACEVVAKYVQEGNALPWHISAAVALAVCTVLGAVSKSVVADGGLQPLDAVKAAAAALPAPANALDAPITPELHAAMDQLHGRLTVMRAAAIVQAKAAAAKTDDVAGPAKPAPGV